MAIKRSRGVELFWQLHKRLYRWSNGRIGARMANLPVLLLDTVGRRSGTPRTNALTYLPWGDAFVVIASVLGEPKHPAWYHNLVAHPTEVTVQDGPEPFLVHVRLVEGEEYNTWWARSVAVCAPYAQYKEKTSRQIPLFVASRPQA